MPLLIRPYQTSDEAQLLARFASDARAPWLRLPHPFTIDGLLAPESGLKVFVAENNERVVGLLAFDIARLAPLLIGPLVPDEQLADLISRALLNYGVDWARQEGLPRVQVKIDLGEERGIGFFLNQGFHLLESRQYILSARKARRAAPPQQEGVRFGPSPEMLSSDYLRLYQEIGEPLGWNVRSNWTRPQVFEHLQQKGVHLLSARAGETYLGFAELQETAPGEAELVHFGLLPAFRGRGVGGALLEYVLYHAFEQLPLERVWLSAMAADSAGLAAKLMARGFSQDRALVFLEKPLGSTPAGSGPAAPPLASADG